MHAHVKYHYTDVQNNQTHEKLDTDYPLDISLPLTYKIIGMHIHTHC